MSDIRDEIQVLQLHEGQALQLLHMWQEDPIDLDIGKERSDHTIESALQELTEILDRSIRARNQQAEATANEPLDRFIRTTSLRGRNRI